MDAVWATAPYLHNGSVPDIATLLDSTKRPKVWSRVDRDSTHYDQDWLGRPYCSLDEGYFEAPEEDRKFLYDTALPGHNNQGHVFGDELSDRDRRALVVYLKTL